MRPAVVGINTKRAYGARSGSSPRPARGNGRFLVESPAGEIGRVEQVWLGERDEPRALAVQTSDGRHGLLLGENVRGVDRQHRWVFVPREAVLLELAPPR